MLSLFTASSFPPGGWEPAGTAGRGSELNPIRACGTLSARLSSCGIHLPLRVFDFLSSGGHLSSGRDSCSSGRLKPVNDPFVSPPGLDFCRMICTFLRRGTPRCPKAGVCPKYCCPVCCRALIPDARTPPLRSSDLLAAARHATPILQLQNPLVHADHDVLRVGRSVGRSHLRRRRQKHLRRRLLLSGRFRPSVPSKCLRPERKVPARTKLQL